MLWPWLSYVPYQIDYINFIIYKYASAARISSFDRKSTALTEARGLLFKAKDVHISNNSWGPLDNGKTLPAMDPSVASAIKEGIIKVGIWWELFATINFIQREVKR